MSIKLPSKAEKVSKCSNSKVYCGNTPLSAKALLKLISGYQVSPPCPLGTRLHETRGVTCETTFKKLDYDFKSVLSTINPVNWIMNRTVKSSFKYLGKVGPRGAHAEFEVVGT